PVVGDNPPDTWLAPGVVQRAQLQREGDAAPSVGPAHAGQARPQQAGLVERQPQLADAGDLAVPEPQGVALVEPAGVVLVAQPLVERRVGAYFTRWQRHVATHLH